MPFGISNYEDESDDPQIERDLRTNFFNWYEFRFNKDADLTKPEDYSMFLAYKAGAERENRTS